MPKHRSKIVPHLATAMLMAEAGNIPLSETAGVDAATIQKAKRGEGIRPVLADYVMEALCTHTFSYKKPGKKSRYA